MRLSLLLFITIGCILADSPVKYTISQEVHNTQSMKFIPHSGSGKYDNYLTLNIPFKPVQKVYQDLQKNLKKSLKNRGEAHITVITPPEYHVLSKYVSIEEINEIAEKMDIQNAKFEIVCIGRGEKMIGGKREQTFYIVVTSPDLLKIRQQINFTYFAKGGKVEDFSTEHYFPHITLGFTKRDLHESDGVIKNKSSFFRHLTTPKKEAKSKKETKSKKEIK